MGRLDDEADDEADDDDVVRDTTRAEADGCCRRCSLSIRSSSPNDDDDSCWFCHGLMIPGT